jgi:hypothetical protein
LSVTTSEALFEQYLENQGYQLRPLPSVKSIRNPEGRVVTPFGDFLAEVKEFEDKTPKNEVFVRDSAPWIRNKINESVKQFKPYKGLVLPCVVVLWSPGIIPHLNEIFILNAMFGDINFIQRISNGELEGITFTKGARLQPKMNTSISAVSVLTQYEGHKGQEGLTVIHNPFSKNPLDKRILCGPWDQQFEFDDDHIFIQTHCGKNVPK